MDLEIKYEARDDIKYSCVDCGKPTKNFLKVLYNKQDKINCQLCEECFALNKKIILKFYKEDKVFFVRTSPKLKEICNLCEKGGETLFSIQIDSKLRVPYQYICHSCINYYLLTIS